MARLCGPYPIDLEKRSRRSGRQRRGFAPSGAGRRSGLGGPYGGGLPHGLGDLWRAISRVPQRGVRLDPRRLAGGLGLLCSVGRSAQHRQPGETRQPGRPRSWHQALPPAGDPDPGRLPHRVRRPETRPRLQSYGRLDRRAARVARLLAVLSRLAGCNSEVRLRRRVRRRQHADLDRSFPP